MRRSLAFVGLVATIFACSLAAHGQVIFNDNFNGSDVTVNDGSGAVNSTANTTAFSSQTDSNNTNGPIPITQNAGGAFYAPTGGYGEQNLASITGNNAAGNGYALGPTATGFSVTVNNINVTGDGGGRGDIPNSANGGFRFELGIVSANAPGGDPELYANTNGGLYVNLFYDKEGHLTGDVRLTTSAKGYGYDGSAASAGGNNGDNGIFELASFSLAQGAGTTSSYTNPLTVTFDLTSTGYAIDFSQAVDVSSGSLTGTFSPLEQSDLSNGVRASLFAQGWSNGDGSGNISNFEVAVPEPSSVYLLGLGFLALAGFGVRRAGLLS